MIFAASSIVVCGVYGDDVSRHDMNCVHFLTLGRLMKR